MPGKITPKHNTTTNLKYSLYNEYNITDVDTVVPVKGGFSLTINPEYFSSSFTNLLRYIKQQCMTNSTGKSDIKRPSDFMYLLRLQHECKDKYNGTSALLFDLIEIFPSKVFENGLIMNPKGFSELKKILRVFINNQYFIRQITSYYLNPGDVLLIHSIKEHKSIGVLKDEDHSERVVNNIPVDVMYFSWSSDLYTGDKSKLAYCFSNWDFKKTELEDTLYQEFPVSIVETYNELIKK